MGKSKPDGKAKGKGSQLVIRIDKTEREAFVSLCETLDTSAAREIRRFMRGFVAAHAQRPPDSADAPADPASTALAVSVAETGPPADPGQTRARQDVPPTAAGPAAPVPPAADTAG